MMYYKSISVSLFVLFLLLTACSSGITEIEPEIAAAMFDGSHSSIGGWTEIFSDDFSGGAIDTDKWTVGEGPAFGGSKATFREDSVSFISDASAAGGGLMQFTMSEADDPADNYEKDYRGAQVATKKTFQYGKYTASMKCGKGRGQISAFFTYNDEGYTRVNEIDFEIMGEADNKIQLNNWYDPMNLLLGNGYIARVPGETTVDEFHEYTFIWLENEIFFYFDDQLIRYTTKKVPNAPSPLLFNYWMSGHGAAWGGIPDPDALPAVMQVDWVKVWTASE